MRRAMVQKLTAMARDRFETEDGEEPDPMEYVADYVANGGNLVVLAEKLRVSRNMLMYWITSNDERKAAYAEAKKLKAEALVDEAQQIVDDADEDRDALNKAAKRADLRTWQAARLDRETWGQNDNKAVQVQVNLGDLHLDSLRRIQTLPTTLPVAPEGPDAEALPSGADAGGLREVEATEG